MFVAEEEVEDEDERDEVVTGDGRVEVEKVGDKSIPMTHC